MLLLPAMLPALLELVLPPAHMPPSFSLTSLLAEAARPCMGLLPAETAAGVGGRAGGQQASRQGASAAQIFAAEALPSE